MISYKDVQNNMELVLTLLITLPILIFSAILHEIAHGYVADRLGDPTARLMGRLTLDPRKHIDPFMSILLPLMLILSGSSIILGGAKPVPIDPYNLREGKKDVALVALAGPFTNILLAIVASLLFHAVSFMSSFMSISLPIATILTILIYVLRTIASINVILAIFNLLPIPPLDGSKIFSLVLPDELARAYLSISSIGVFILFLLLLFPIGGFSLSQVIASLFDFASHLLGI